MNIEIDKLALRDLEYIELAENRIKDELFLAGTYKGVDTASGTSVTSETILAAFKAALIAAEIE